jgi:hypothetical protein
LESDLIWNLRGNLWRILIKIFWEILRGRF